MAYRSWSPQPGLVHIEIDDGTETPEPQPTQAAASDESGRGLFLVQMLVQELGGDWGFSHRGTTVWCRLPIGGQQTGRERSQP